MASLTISQWKVLLMGTHLQDLHGLSDRQSLSSPGKLWAGGRRRRRNWVKTVVERRRSRLRKYYTLVLGLDFLKTLWRGEERMNQKWAEKSLLGKDQSSVWLVITFWVTTKSDQVLTPQRRVWVTPGKQTLQTKTSWVPVSSVQVQIQIKFQDFNTDFDSISKTSVQFHLLYPNY